MSDDGSLKCLKMVTNCDTEKRYRQFSVYLKETFGEKVYKVTLDAGFSCPNRDGSISSGGCTFCDASGSFSQAHSNKLNIENQLETGIKTLKKRFKAKKFLSYFQAFSNTYKPVEQLETIYKSALNHKDVVGISIGTRPDCVDEKKLDLIASLGVSSGASFSENFYTCLEYGLQSIHNKTLALINRGHDYECFERAYFLAKERGINVCAHVILGLCDETKADMIETAKKLAQLKVDGVKIHLLCALKGTKLEQMYYNGEFKPLSEDEYVELVCDFLEHLHPDTLIHRIAGNGLSKIQIAPVWLSNKFETLNRIDAELVKRNSYQGFRVK